MKKVFFVMMMLCALLVACKPDGGDEVYNPEDNQGGQDEVVIYKPVVATGEVSDVTETTAVCGGDVTADGGAEVTSRGVCWSVNQNPTIEDEHTTDGNGLGVFTSNLSDLASNTTYYVRAYATNSEGTAYGEEVCFVTEEEPLPEPETINGYNYVDLGLPSGVKWATCNVGASTPEAYGDYYAWGETEVKNTYDFNNNSTWGSSVNNISGNATYDVARKKWGGSWRMPTNVEMDELASKCTWTWIANNGVNGYEITGPNGNSIFMPASGYHYGAELKLNGEGGYYWTSVPESDETGGNFYAYYIVFLKDGTKEMSPTYRFIGLTVRPVSE